MTDQREAGIDSAIEDLRCYADDVVVESHFPELVARLRAVLTVWDIRLPRDRVEIMLTTAALGYSAIVSAAARQGEPLHDAYLGSLAHLRHAALGYAASCGNADASERAELLALRNFRDGIVALRGELSVGPSGEERLAEIAETIDAFLMLHGGAR